ncbi:ABC transporter permease [Sodalis sp. RH22]|uniref:ABC transporter permease n=1 Tax=unclassified Sodalis (in: enterobacteria) TaxID=2636512 RepID=UPI0039B4B331
MNMIKNILSGYNSILALIVLVIMISMNVAFPGFISILNMESITTGFIGECFIALGMLLVIILRGIDLSVASTLPFSAIIVSQLLQFFTGLTGSIYFSIFISVIITLILCICVGVINGLLVNRLKVHAFIVTLAMAMTLRGINLVITNGSTISGLPAKFTAFGQDYLFGLPLMLWLFIIVAIGFGYALANHRYFQQVYFIGGNEEAAKLNGINVDLFKIFAFAFSALMAGIAGIIYASQFGAANMAYGQNIELRVIAAVFIGGASMFGGVGTFMGTILGVFFLAILYNGFTWTGINTYYQEILIGGMLVSAVFIGEVTKRRTNIKVVLKN